MDAIAAALLDERRGYVVRGLTDRVAQVDAQLAALGVEVPVPGAPEAHRPDEIERAVALEPESPERPRGRRSR